MDEKIIYAKYFGVVPGYGAEKMLCDLLSSLNTNNEQKIIKLNKGVYHINSSECEKHTLFITNTAGEKEFDENETPYVNEVPLYLKGINNLILDGDGAVFEIDGKVTNIALEECENITLKNLEIRHVHPDMHEFKVINKTAFTVDFELDRDSLYEVKDNKLYFCGENYRSDATKNARVSNWIGLIRKDTPENIKRVLHPLCSARKIVDLKKGKIRVNYPNTFRFKVGDRYYFYDVRRQYAGIFINKCKNITLDNIKQRFNYSLALVCQDSENISLVNSEFAPEKDSARKMASIADFAQICMCRGDVLIDNNVFDGAGDDCINVHGVHFKIKDVKENEITVSFKHPQTYGFNPLRAEDEIAFINTDTLLETGKAKIISSKMLNNYDIKLTLDSSDKAIVGDAIEDISACPNIRFSNNTLKRIITRGVLVTTRGKAVVENNHFVSCSMSGVLLSDDAKNWYESGMCRDVEIKNNTFDYCGQTPILIKPENRIYKSAVHKNIKIEGNVFKSYKGFCINAYSCDNIEIKNNKFSSDKIIKDKKCNNVIISD